uniref:Nucleoside diphosphate-linked moiety X motif 6-like isoform X1 n=1 Tax=Crassostrea virginica TaxID=6565 RepID=A0A8B8EAG0_CRAVI|nr:nucleoside diphosphate-linked moiety X motif 6-like isoform X1 [Crassostrea virginica]XP_022337626.1 nucleoside diphosphate-linked moiety X motif 6-like isoform X1 [Crassostrea virginica]XP_022337627.1 nucleoside diphosphate-linked moiety X motif 6-like isoform X1 [Crassostrea virginica]XP_022337628.1 nucleoside diphosphate-linked moiety X motif 6-like isoform X1 [Crassostrea virginica]
MTQESQGFVVTTDIFNGLSIDTELQNFNIEKDFDHKLAEAIPIWKQDGVRGLWVKVHLPHTCIVPVCSKHGFDFNHAQPGYVLMTKWLPDNEENKLPEYANQFLGVAGFVLNENGELLVIRERFSVIKSKPWKLPGGLADKGEDLAMTARREVKEETGIEAEFVSVLAFRHQHNFRFGCSDWYFVCLMKALTTEIQHCPQEIDECKWISIKDYLADPNLTEANRFFAQCYLNQQKSGATISPTLIDSWNKKTQHQIYTIQTPSEDRDIRSDDTT